MSESLKSFFILFGGVLVVLALWYLSVQAVRYDTRRRLAKGELREIERKSWIAAAAALPLLGFALYVFVGVLRRYLTPVPPEPAPWVITGPNWVEPTTGTQTEVRAQAGKTAGGVDTFSANPGGALDRIITHTGSNGAQSHHPPATLPSPYQPAPAHYVLEVQEGPYTGEQYPLDPLPVRIGRGSGVKIALDNDLNVSRNHAEIYEWNGTLHILDLGSTHGTLINGVPITDQVLTPGDHLAVGGTILILRELP